MKIKTPFFTLEIEILFIIVFLIYLLSEKLKVFLLPFYTCYLFILFHELMHMLVGSIFGKNVDKFKLSIAGVSISFLQKGNEYIYNKKSKYACLIDILIYVAGPVSNLLLAIIFRNIPLVFEINIFFAVLNMLPMYPLDGYNIVSNSLRILNIKECKIDIIQDSISSIVQIFLICFGIIQLVLFKSPSILFFGVYIYILSITNKRQKRQIKGYKRVLIEYV